MSLNPASEPVKDFDRDRPLGYWGIDVYDFEELEGFEQ